MLAYVSQILKAEYIMTGTRSFLMLLSSRIHNLGVPTILVYLVLKPGRADGELSTNSMSPHSSSTSRHRLAKK